MIAARPIEFASLTRRVLGSRGIRASAGRLSWGLADQAVSSLTNFAVGIFVARSLGLVEFGIFSLAWVTYGVAQNITRGLATDPLVVRFSGVHADHWRDAVPRSSGTALSVGCAAGLACLLGGIGIGGTLGAAFAALGIALPALMLQESWRYAFFAAGVGRKAFVNDVVWAAALIPALIIATKHGTVAGFVLAWGLASAPAAAFGCVQSGLFPRMSAIRGWLHAQRDLGYRYMVENVAASGSAQIRMYGLGAIAGLADVGAVRGAQLLLGPFLAVIMGLSMVAVPEGARVLRRDPGRLRWFCLALGWGQAFAALLWGLALLILLPDHVGEFVLGDVWSSAKVLIVPTTVALMGASLVNAGITGVRTLGASRRSLRAHLFGAAAYVAGGVGGAALGGAAGSTWGIAIAGMLSATVWWSQLQAGLASHQAPIDAEPDAADPDGRRRS